MTASILTLSRADCKALQITDAYSIHRTIYSLFPKAENESRDFLFADKGGDFSSRRILILSKREPLQPRAGKIETKNIPPSFLQFTRYGFEVRLNAVKKEKVSGKIVAIRGRDNLREWFCNKSPAWGFETEKESLQIQYTGVQEFTGKNENAITHNEAVFMGKITVTNRDAFIKSFECGIGRAKSFGFGLLQIIPLQDDINEYKN
jgi:CRISPR system Cascade subunit CasE